MKRWQGYVLDHVSNEWISAVIPGLRLLRGAARAARAAPRPAYGNRPLGGGRVYGEQPYGKADAKTSDVAVDRALKRDAKRLRLRNKVLHSVAISRTFHLR
jgi:hypothetical protein